MQHHCSTGDKILPSWYLSMQELSTVLCIETGLYATVWHLSKYSVQCTVYMLSCHVEGESTGSLYSLQCDLHD